MSSAGTEDIEIDQGAYYYITLSLTNEHGLPVNLEGYTGAGKIRSTPDSAVVLATFDVTFEVPRTSGKVTFSLEASVTSAFTFNRANYDLFLTDMNGKPDKVLKGKVTVFPSNTR